LGCAEDFVAEGIVWSFGRRRGWDGGDYAAEFGAGDPGEGRLVLVFAADLQQVEEVCCCAVDADCVLVWCWGWGGEVGYAEVLGALEEGVRRVVGVGEIGWRLTETYSFTWMPRMVEGVCEMVLDGLVCVLWIECGIDMKW
jgi:hypothetical protein